MQIKGACSYSLIPLIFFKHTEIWYQKLSLLSLYVRGFMHKLDVV